MLVFNSDALSFAFSTQKLYSIRQPNTFFKWIRLASDAPKVFVISALLN